MGSRSARSFTYNLYEKELTYGDEYKSVLEIGPVKYVHRKDDHGAVAPVETMTIGRIYATIDNKNGALNSITFYDLSGRISRQLDYTDHKNMGPHVHEWEWTDRKATRGDPRPADAMDKRWFRVIQSIYNRHGGKEMIGL